jgi:hypothetical protein
MANNQNDVSTSEVTSTDIQNEAVSMSSTAVDKKNSNSKTSSQKKGAIIDRIADIMADDISRMAHPRDKEEVRNVLSDIIITLFSINGLSEYEQGVVAQDKVYYRFDEYKIPEAFQSFVLGAKVVINDVGTAKDFLNRDKYNNHRKVVVMTPGQMAQRFEWLGAKLRKPVTLVALSRPRVSLLADVTTFAVKGDLVTDREQKSIIFLTQTFDDQQTVGITEWAHEKALLLFKSSAPKQG